MYQLLQYYGRWQGFKGRMAQLPSWARLVLMLAALPGIALIALSIVAFLVSLLALLLLTVPLYRVMCAVLGVKEETAGGVGPAGFGSFGPPPEGMDVVIDEPTTGETTVVDEPSEEPRRTRRQIDVKIVE
jgi:hypothetical protein